MKRYRLLIVFLIFSLLSYSQIDSTKPVISSEDLGRFLITTNDSVDIFVTLDKVKYFNKEYQDYPEADVSIRIEDSNKKIIFIRNLATTNNRLWGLNSIELSGLGKALLFIYQIFPCYGKGCLSFQLFGFNDLGYFVPFTGLIDLDMGCNSDSVSHYKSKWFNRQGLEVPSKRHISYYLPDNQLYLVVPDYIDYCQLRINSYYPIYKSGILCDKFYQVERFEKMQLYYDNSNFQVIKSIDNERFKEPIKLYSKPDTLSKVKLVTLKVNTIVKYIDGFHNSNYWVHLRIDGNEGYILWNNLYNLGLEPCD